MIGMVWLLEGLFLVVLVMCWLYMGRFNSSAEGRDERGKEIQYKTNNVLFQILFVGVVLLASLAYPYEVIQVEFLPNILRYFALSMGVFGAVLTYINKNREH